MATPPRSKPKFEAKRAAILNAAMQILYRRGVAGMTLSAVAQAVGLNTPGVTYYFARKDDLAAACYLRRHRALDELLTRAARIGSAKRRFREAFAGMFAWQRGIRRGEQHEFVPFADMRALDEPNRVTVEAAFAQMAKKARALFEGPEFVHLDSADRRARGHLLLEHLFWVMSWLYEFDVEDYPRVLERTCDIYLNGLRDSEGGGTFDFSETELELDVESNGKEDFLIAATRALNEYGYWGRLGRSHLVGRQRHQRRLLSSSHEQGMNWCSPASIAPLTSPKPRRCRRCTAMAPLGTCSNSRPARWRSFSSPSAAHCCVSTFCQQCPRNCVTRFSGRANRITNRYVALISDGAQDGSLRLVDAQIASQMLRVTINAIAAGPIWVKGIHAQPGAAPLSGAGAFRRALARRSSRSPGSVGHAKPRASIQLATAATAFGSRSRRSM